MSLGSSTHLREEFEGACRRRGRSRTIRASGMRCGVGQEPGQPCGGGRVKEGARCALGGARSFQPMARCVPSGPAFSWYTSRKLRMISKMKMRSTPLRREQARGAPPFLRGELISTWSSYPMHQCTSAPVHQCTNAAGGGGASGWHAPVDDEQRFERGCCRFEEGHFERRDERSKDEGHARD